MRHSVSLAALVFPATLLLCAPARAALVSVDYQATGDGLLTRDTATGLDWLDLTLTRGDLLTSTGVSVNQILGGFGGFIGAGFRFATNAEVKTLFENAGITDFSGNLGAANVAGTTLLVSLMGNVNAHPTVRTVQGFAEVDLAAGTANVPALSLVPPGVDPSILIESAGAYCLPAVPGCSFSLDAAPSVGAFLVRPYSLLPPPAAVPAPTAMAMLAFGLAGLAAAQGRRTRS